LVLGTGIQCGTVATHQYAIISFSDIWCLTSAMSAIIWIIDTNSISRTFSVFLAFHQVRIANRVGVAGVSARTVTDKASVQVSTEGIETTGRFGQFRALVHVSALFAHRISYVTSPTDALMSPISGNAFLIERTRITVGAVDSFFAFNRALGIGITSEIMGTNAFIRTGSITTDSVVSARLVCHTFVNVDTTGKTITLSNIALSADTQRVTTGIQFTLRVFATE